MQADSVNFEPNQCMVIQMCNGKATLTIKDANVQFKFDGPTCCT